MNGDFFDTAAASTSTVWIGPQLAEVTLTERPLAYKALLLEIRAPSN